MHPPGVVDSAYRRHGPALVRKAMRLLQTRDDAQDVVHELFADALRGRVRELELAYLYRAVTNRCLNLLRDRGNRQRLLDGAEDLLRGPVRTRLDDRVVDLDLLVRLCDELDRRSREILVFHFFDDMTQEEIATVLGVSRRAVVKRLTKIRAKAAALGGGSQRGPDAAVREGA